MQTGLLRLLILLVVWRGTTWIQAQPASTVAVDFRTTNATPLNLGFAGFTTELLGTGIELGDTNMQRYAAMLSPGWLLYPAGTTGDAFNWQTGLTETNWVNTLASRESSNNTASSLSGGTVLALQGKGGVQFTNFASLARNLGGAKIIVCINGFTDTNAANAGAFAAFALNNHIQVAAWELCNEPYLFQGTNDFFTNGTDYAIKMLPFRNAIKAADPNAVVALFFSDPARPGLNWDNDLARYGATNQYWDAVVYHYYPQLPTNAPFADLMAMDNGILSSNTTLYVTNVLMAKSGPNTTFLLTEFDPVKGNGDGTQNAPTSTLYGGIFAAEYVLRLSTCPRVSFAGSYQLVNGSGVDTTNRFWNAVIKAATNSYVTNTVGLPFGYFLSAQGSAEAVAYGALNRSTAAYPTTVGTNCPSVPMDTNGLTHMPAIYSVAYQGGNGKRYVVLTNKGSNAVPVQVTQDGVALATPLTETFVTGNDPSVINSNPPATGNVVIQSETVTNPVLIPPYSVVRLEWTAFTVPKPALALTVSASNEVLRWAGLTNVVYDVQEADNLAASWTTLARVSSVTSNFYSTNWPRSTLHYYRLLIP